MKILGEVELERLMLDWISDQRERLGEPVMRLGRDTELISDRVLDSVGFTELIVFVESATGLSIDIGEMSHDDLQSISGICRHVRRLTTPSS